MELTKEQARFFTEVIAKLDCAKQQFDYCKENQIMNGHPIRVMEECKVKLQNLVRFKVPDVLEYPEIHQYMKSVEPHLEKLKQQEEYEKSPEGQKSKKLKEIEHITNMIASMEQSERYYINQMKHYEWKAKKCVSDSNSLKSKLFELQFSELEVSPSSAVGNLVV